MMNAKAKELGMNDTTFVNCHGLDEDGHLTSAYDIALMSRELLTKHPSITNYTTIWTDSLRDGKSALSNTNKLVRNYSGCTGLKTGSTSKALFNLSASATRDNLSLIAVVMKAPTSAIRFANATSLLDYGFSNYKYELLCTQNDFVKEVDVQKGNKSKVSVIYENSVGKIVKKNEDSKIDTIVEMKEKLIAPIKKGDIIGTVKFKNGDNEIGSTNLIAESDVYKKNFSNTVSEVFKKWFNILR